MFSVALVRGSRAGRELAEIHLNYETQPPAPVEIVGGGDYRVIYSPIAFPQVQILPPREKFYSAFVFLSLQSRIFLVVQAIITF